MGSNNKNVYLVWWGIASFLNLILVLVPRVLRYGFDALTQFTSAISIVIILSFWLIILPSYLVFCLWASTKLYERGFSKLKATLGGIGFLIVVWICFIAFPAILLDPNRDHFSLIWFIYMPLVVVPYSFFVRTHIYNFGTVDNWRHWVQKIAVSSLSILLIGLFLLSYNTVIENSAILLNQERLCKGLTIYLPGDFTLNSDMSANHNFCYSELGKKGNIEACNSIDWFAEDDKDICFIRVSLYENDVSICQNVNKGVNYISCLLNDDNPNNHFGHPCLNQIKTGMGVKECADSMYAVQEPLQVTPESNKQINDSELSEPLRPQTVNEVDEAYLPDDCSENGCDQDMRAITYGNTNCNQMVGRDVDFTGIVILERTYKNGIGGYPSSGTFYDYYGILSEDNCLVYVLGAEYPTFGLAVPKTRYLKFDLGKQVTLSGEMKTHYNHFYEDEQGGTFYILDLNEK